MAVGLILFCAQPLPQQARGGSWDASDSLHVRHMLGVAGAGRAVRPGCVNTVHFSLAHDSSLLESRGSLDPSNENNLCCLMREYYLAGLAVSWQQALKRGSQTQ